VPLEAYHFFINKFVDAIRYEIARSAEKSYESLRLSDFQKMLMLSNQAELTQFAQANSGKEGVSWVAQGDRVHF